MHQRRAMRSDSGVRLDRRARLLLTVALATFASYALNYYWHRGVTLPESGDFFALWSYGRVLMEHPAAALYDHAGLRAMQVAIGMDPAIQNPFPYPPVFMLLVWPLGLLPFSLSYAAWTGTTLVAFVVAVAAPRFRPLTVALAVLAPVATVNVVAGQSGFLSGALLLGGVRLASSRPWLAGMLIGSLSYKPQLGLLIPVALVAAGAWRAVAAAALTALALAAVTCALFGPSIWLAWLAALPGYAEMFAAKDALHRLQPTVLANLLLLGVPGSVAQAGQGLAACATAVVTWLAFRRGVTPAAIAVLAAATLLATPHALVYDLPVVTGAVLVFAEARMRSGLPFGLPGQLLLLVVLCLPAVMPWSAWPISSPVLLAFVALAFREPLPRRDEVGRRQSA